MPAIPGTIMRKAPFPSAAALHPGMEQVRRGARQDPERPGGLHQLVRDVARRGPAQHSRLRLPAQLDTLLQARIDAQVVHLQKQEAADPAGTAGRAAAIDREITNEAPWVPLVTPRFVDLTSARVRNYEDNTGAVLLDQLWVR